MLSLSGCSEYTQDAKKVEAQITTTVNEALLNNVAMAKPNNKDIPLTVTHALSHTPKNAVIEKKISLSVKGLSMEEFISSLARETNTNIILSPGINHNVTLDLKDVTFKEVLDMLTTIYPIDVKQESKKTFIITPEELITKTFRLTGLNIQRSGSSSMDIVGSSEIGTSTAAIKTTSNNTKALEQIEATCKSLAKTEGYSLSIDHHSNTIAVTTTRKKLDKVEHFINYLNAMARKQVTVEAKILEVQLNKRARMGLSFSSNKFDADVSSGEFKFLNLKKGAASLGNGILSGFSGIINMLENQGDVHVLSSPRISTLNRQKAVMKVGQDKYFISQADNTTTQTNDNNLSNTVSQNLAVRPFFNGVALDVTPEIIDDDNIILHIHPIVTSVSTENISSTILGKSTTLTVPKTDVRETDAMVHAQNGQVVIIAGLIQEKVRNEQKTLRFTDVPVGNDDNSDFVELVILLQPRIVTPEFMIDKLKDYRNKFASHGKANVSRSL